MLFQKLLNLVYLLSFFTIAYSHFQVINSSSTNPTLLAIVEEINAVLISYKQTPYYDPPLFHISVASVVGNLLLKATDNKEVDDKKKTVGSAHKALRVDQIHCTFGTTKHYSITLDDK